MGFFLLELPTLAQYLVLFWGINDQQMYCFIKKNFFTEPLVGHLQKNCTELLLLTSREDE